MASIWNSIGHYETRRAIEKAAAQQLRIATSQQGVVGSLQERVRKLEEQGRARHEQDVRVTSWFADLKKRTELLEADVASLPHPEVLQAVRGEIAANQRGLEAANRAIDGIYRQLRPVDADPIVQVDTPRVADEPVIDAEIVSHEKDLPVGFLEQAEWLATHAMSYNSAWEDMKRLWFARLRFLRESIERGGGGVWRDVDTIIRQSELIAELNEEIANLRAEADREG
jgi:hypothetical protein